MRVGDCRDCGLGALFAADFREPALDFRADWSGHSDRGHGQGAAGQRRAPRRSGSAHRHHVTALLTTEDTEGTEKKNSKERFNTCHVERARGRTEALRCLGVQSDSIKRLKRIAIRKSETINLQFL